MRLLNAKDFAKLLDVDPAVFCQMQRDRKIPRANYIVGGDRIPIWEAENIHNFFKVKCRNPELTPEKERIKS